MVASGRRGSWQPRGSALLVAVIALSVVALAVHGGIAFALLRGTLHGATTRDAGPVAAPTPAPISPATPTTTAGRGGTPPATLGSGGSASALHLDHACLVSDNPPTKAAIPAGDPFGTDLGDLGTGAELQRLYSVKNGGLTPNDGAGDVRDCDQQLWRVVAAAAPPDVLAYVDELLVYDADIASNGPDLYVGEVVPKDGQSAAPDPAHWRLALAPNGATDLDVAVTVAHEVGHLISLNRGQMTGQDEKACPGVFIDTGCLNDNALLLAYLDDTWTDADWKAFDAADSVTDPDQHDQALQDFYDQRPSQFVDSYAATYPSEDFAETFGVWCAVGPKSPVLPEVIEGDPTNGAAKLAWFDEPGNPIGAAQRAQCDQLRTLTR